MNIGTRAIGPDAPAFIIAEVAQAHNGDFDRALAFVDALAASGVDAVKFQTHLAACESSLDEPFRVSMGGPDATRFAYWQRMEFTEAQWRTLAKRCADQGVMFLSSAFSLEAVELLADIGMPAWKIGSGEFRSFELVEAMHKAGGPILLSTGMSRFKDITAMVEQMRASDMPFVLFQCTSKYPTPLDEVGLNVLSEFRQRYACPVGLSDHSGSVYPSLAAMAQGAEMIEVHAILEAGDAGVDAAASLVPAEFRMLADARDAFHAMRVAPVDKDEMAETLKEMRGLFSKSAAPARALSAGTVIEADMLVPRKPGTGVPFVDRNDIIGKTLIRDVVPEHVLKWSDVE